MEQYEYNIGNDTLKIDGRVDDVIACSLVLSLKTPRTNRENTLRSGLLSSLS